MLLKCAKLIFTSTHESIFFFTYFVYFFSEMYVRFEIKFYYSKKLFPKKEISLEIKKNCPKKMYQHEEKKDKAQTLI